MCWESLDDSEQASKKRKTHAQDEETNDKANELEDKTHTKRTANMGNQLDIPVDNLKLGADDDVSTLTTQETSAKNYYGYPRSQTGCYEKCMRFQ